MSSIKIKAASAQKIREAAKSFPQSLHRFTRLHWSQIKQTDKNKGFYKHVTRTGKAYTIRFLRSTDGKITWYATACGKTIEIDGGNFSDVYLAAQAVNFLRTRSDIDQSDVVSMFSEYYLETHVHLANRFNRLTIRSTDHA